MVGTLGRSNLKGMLRTFGLARTRQAARQFVNHGHVKVNGRKADIPSYQVAVSDEIEVSEHSSSRQLATRSIEEGQSRVPAPWLTLDESALRATVNRLPNPDEIETGVNLQLIVEFYSR